MKAGRSGRVAADVFAKHIPVLAPLYCGNFRDYLAAIRRAVAATPA
jgi:hypothetical protein